MSFHILSLLTDVLSTSYSTSPSHPPSTSPTFYIFFYLFFSLQSYFYIRYILLLFPRLSFFLKCVSSLSYLFVPFCWIIYSPSILVFAFFKKNSSNFHRFQFLHLYSTYSFSQIIRTECKQKTKLNSFIKENDLISYSPPISYLILENGRYNLIFFNPLTL